MLKLKLQILVLILLFISIASYSQHSFGNKPFKIVDFDELLPYLSKTTDTLYIINFWATWCAPCIKEIPYFEEIGEMYKDENVKVFMVSLDFPDMVQNSLIPFMKKNNMKNEVLLLDDPDANRWIPLVDDEWTGAIPATLVYDSKGRKFYKHSLSKDQLMSIVNEFRDVR